MAEELARSEKAHTKANGAFDIVINLFLEPLEAAQAAKPHRIWKREQRERGSLVFVAMFHRIAANALSPEKRHVSGQPIKLAVARTSRSQQCSIPGRGGRFRDACGQYGRTNGEGEPEVFMPAKGLRAPGWGLTHSETTFVSSKKLEDKLTIQFSGAVLSNAQN